MTWQWLDTFLGFILGYFVGMIAIVIGYLAGRLEILK